MTMISWQRVPGDRAVLGQGAAPVVTATEYLLVYQREAGHPSTLKKLQRRTPASEKVFQQYNMIVHSEGKAELVDEFQDNSDRPVKIYRHSDYEIERLSAKELGANPTAYYRKYVRNFEKAARVAAQQKESTFQQTILSRVDPSELHSVEYTPSRGKRKGQHVRSLYISKGIVLYLRDYAFLQDKRIWRNADMNNFWPHDEIPVTGIEREGGVAFKRGKKPERLLQRIIEMATEPGDLVLDSFGGSGTTGAVAHKMGRKWILVELGEHATTHCLPRLSRVVDGTDQSGISRAVGWTGGGGFRFMQLGPSLYQHDQSLGMTALNPAYQNGELIDAICTELGYERISEGAFHGRRSAELLHVSEDFVSQHYMDTLTSLVPTDHRLRVLAARHAGDATLAESVRLDRIPDALLERFSLPGSDDATVTLSLE